MATLLPFLLASYLSFSAPDTRLFYGMLLAIVAIAVAMGLFRALGKVRESRQVQRSSWITYERIAKVKGLSRIEIQLLTRLLRRARHQPRKGHRGLRSPAGHPSRRDRQPHLRRR